MVPRVLWKVVNKMIGESEVLKMLSCTPKLLELAIESGELKPARIYNSARYFRKEDVLKLKHSMVCVRHHKDMHPAEIRLFHDL